MSIVCTMYRIYRASLLWTYSYLMFNSRYKRLEWCEAWCITFRVSLMVTCDLIIYCKSCPLFWGDNPWIMMKCYNLQNWLSYVHYCASSGHLYSEWILPFISCSPPSEYVLEVSLKPDQRSRDMHGTKTTTRHYSFSRRAIKYNFYFSRWSFVFVFHRGTYFIAEVFPSLCPPYEFSPSKMKNVSVASECFHYSEWRAASLESAAKNKTRVSRELNK